MLNAKEETQDFKFAVFNGSGEITGEMYKEVREFAEYVKSLEKRKNASAQNAEADK